MEPPLTIDQLLAAYANGYFPMALEKDDPELYWFSPEERGVLPLDGFNIPRGLKRSMKTRPYVITVDQDFEGVIRACGTLTDARDETWINEKIVTLYTDLFRAGHAHSVEVWAREDSGKEEGAAEPLPRERQRGLMSASEFSRSGEGAVEHADSRPHPDSQHSLRSLANPASPEGRGAPVAPLVANTNRVLIGGLYGVSLGGAFFGESMFSRAPDASKMALVRLVEILREAGYQLLDTQYVNEHLKQFGVMAVPKNDYMIKLENALRASPNPSTRFSTASVRSGAASSSSASST